MSVTIAFGCSTDAAGPAPEIQGKFHIAFMELHSNGFNVSVCDEDGQAYTPVSRQYGARHNSAHVWSPNGERLVYISDDTLRIYNLKSGITTSIDPVRSGFTPNDGSMPSWSPDGSRFIALSEGNPRQYAIFEATGTLQTVSNILDGWKRSVYLWSPRGDLIASSAGNGVGLLNANGDVLTVLEDVGELVNWSKSGASVITATELTDSTYAIHEVDVSTGKRIDLLEVMTKDRSFNYSVPSLEVLTFTTGNTIERYDLRTGMKHVIELPTLVKWAELHPDGKKYVYHGGPTDSRFDGDIHIVNADGSNDRIIRHFGIFPRWSSVRQ